MKTNLDKAFKTNKSLEKDGVWFVVEGGPEFLVRRFGGVNATKMQKIVSELNKPYVRLIESKQLSEEKTTELSTLSFIKCCLIDWKGVEIDGQEAPYSEELAAELFKALPDLADRLFEYARDMDNFREDLGN